MSNAESLQIITGIEKWLNYNSEAAPVLLMSHKSFYFTLKTFVTFNLTAENGGHLLTNAV